MSTNPLRMRDQTQVTISKATKGFVVTKNPYTQEKTESKSSDFKLWENADKEGELLKSRGNFKECSNIVVSNSRQWSPRYFILKSHTLFYFDAQPSEGQTSSKCVELKDATMKKVEEPNDVIR